MIEWLHRTPMACTRVRYLLTCTAEMASNWALYSKFERMGLFDNGGGGGGNNGSKLLEDEEKDVLRRELLAGDADGAINSRTIFGTSGTYRLTFVGSNMKG